MKPTVALAMWEDLPQKLFTDAAWRRLTEIADIDRVPRFDKDDDDARLSGIALDEVDVLVTGWGAPLLDDALLDRMPRLHAVIHSAGSVRGIATEEAFRRGIRFTSNADVNAIAVAEFALAAILLSGKRIFQISRDYMRTRQYRPWASEPARWGNRGLRVGVIGASRIGRRVIALLQQFDVEVLLSDPTLDAPIPGARLVPLDELLTESDVVSIHAPSTPATHHLLNRRTLALMPDGSTLINTSRGELVDVDALLAELHDRRLHAVIDVTQPDPLPEDSPLFDAPNLLLTPHIAGSLGSELTRFGDAVVDEVELLISDAVSRRRVEPSGWELMA